MLYMYNKHILKIPACFTAAGISVILRTERREKPDRAADRKALLSCQKKRNPLRSAEKKRASDDLASNASRGLDALSLAFSIGTLTYLAYGYKDRFAVCIVLASSPFILLPEHKRQKGIPLEPPKDKDKKRAAAPRPGKQTERPPTRAAPEKVQPLLFQCNAKRAKIQH